MGISNSIGSNTFDILLCLGLPWFIKATFMPTLQDKHWVSNRCYLLCIFVFNFVFSFPGWNKFSWYRVQCNIASIFTPDVVRRFCSEQIQIRQESWAGLSFDVRSFFSFSVTH